MGVGEWGSEDATDLDIIAYDSLGIDIFFFFLPIGQVKQLDLDLHFFLPTLLAHHSF